MKFQIGQLIIEVSPRSIKINGLVESTVVKVEITHQIFSGDTTSVAVKVGDLEFTAQI